MDAVPRGIIGCGNVTEVKSGPGFQKADGSSLVAAMRRDRQKAEDHDRRRGVPRVPAGEDELTPAIAGAELLLDLASHGLDLLDFLHGPLGQLLTPVFPDGDVVVRGDGCEEVSATRNPPHVHQPLNQSVADELRGRGRCESTGESRARASWVMEPLLESYREAR